MKKCLRCKHTKEEAKHCVEGFVYHRYKNYPKNRKSRKQPADVQERLAGRLLVGGMNPKDIYAILNILKDIMDELQ